MPALNSAVACGTVVVSLSAVSVCDFAASGVRHARKAAAVRMEVKRVRIKVLLGWEGNALSINRRECRGRDDCGRKASQTDLAAFESLVKAREAVSAVAVRYRTPRPKKRKARDNLPGSSFQLLQLVRSLSAGNYAVDHLTRLGRLRMSRSRAPRRRRTSNRGYNNGHVLRRTKALERSRSGRGSREVSTTVVGGILLFVDHHVAKVRLHRGDVRLVFCISELRNRDRGKDADDHNHDKKLNKGKTLFVAHFVSLKRLDKCQLKLGALRD